MTAMFGSSLLIAAALSGAPLKLSAQAGEDRSWLSAVVVGALLETQRAAQTEPVLGFANGQPQPLLIVDMPSPYAQTQVRAEVHTALAFYRMQTAAQRFGLSLFLNSGFRTNQQQQDVFDLYRRGRGPLAARPGFSNHQSGHALDIDMRLPRVRLWMSRHAHEFGFQRTVPSENWHWEFRGSVQRLLRQPVAPGNS
ncbi:MAG: D-alanyl-D-alanine carboxypeptidase family protein [Polyangia bacterium]